MKMKGNFKGLKSTVSNASQCKVKSNSTFIRSDVIYKQRVSFGDIDIPMLPLISQSTMTFIVVMFA